MEFAPTHPVFLISHLRPRQWLPVLDLAWPPGRLPLSAFVVSPPSSWPQAVPPCPLPCLGPGPGQLPPLLRCFRLLRPRQWLPVPCRGCPCRPLSRRLRLLGPRQGLPVLDLASASWKVAPAGLCRVASVFSAPGRSTYFPVEVAPASLYRVASVF